MSEPTAENSDSTRKVIILGIGLDSDDHRRITTGKNFALVGGSETTHEAMTETVIKLNEKVAKAGRELGQMSQAEFEDIAGEVGLHRHGE